MSTIAPLSHLGADSGSDAGGVPSSTGSAFWVTPEFGGIPKVISTYLSVFLSDMRWGKVTLYLGRLTHRTGCIFQSLHHDFIAACIHVLVVDFAHEVSARDEFAQIQSQDVISDDGHKVSKVASQEHKKSPWFGLLCFLHLRGLRACYNPCNSDSSHTVGVNWGACHTERARLRKHNWDQERAHMIQ